MSVRLVSMDLTETAVLTPIQFHFTLLKRMETAFIPGIRVSDIFSRSGVVEWIEGASSSRCEERGARASYFDEYGISPRILFSVVGAIRSRCNMP